MIFGTTYALRLGAGPQNTSLPGGYAVISSSDPNDLVNFSNTQECCVEAWVNVWPQGSGQGDIVSLCPSTEKGIGLRLWLFDGNINFMLLTQPAGVTWTTLTASASAAAILDGQWHHIAVSTQINATNAIAGNDIRIYIDGQSQTLTPLTPVTGSFEPATTAAILVNLGADATGSS